MGNNVEIPKAIIERNAEKSRFKGKRVSDEIIFKKEKKIFLGDFRSNVQEIVF